MRFPINVLFSAVATEDVLECKWCDCQTHRTCTKISSKQCVVLTNVTIFFCTVKLPDALKSCNDHESINKRPTTLENKLTELQLAETAYLW